MPKKGILAVMIVAVLSALLIGCGKSGGVGFEETVSSMEKAKEALNEASKNQDQRVGKKARDTDNFAEESAKDDFNKSVETYSKDKKNMGDGSPGEILIYYAYLFLFKVREYMWPILGLCWGSGGFLFFFARGNPKLRKFGLFNLIIGGTVVVLLFTFAPAIQRMFSV